MRERHNSLRQRGMEKRSLRQWHSRPSDTLKNRKNYTRSASLPTSQKNPQGTAGWLRGQIVPEGKRKSERNNTGLTAKYSQKSEKISNSQRIWQEETQKDRGLVLYRDIRVFSGRKRQNKREEVAPVSLGTLKGEARSLMHSHSASSATAPLFLTLHSVLFQDFWSASLCINTISF